jgi:hypothetical protein
VIVEAVLKDQLAADGIVVGGISVTEVGLRETRITKLRLGMEDELRAEDLRVTYEAGALLRGEIESVTVDGLVLRLDLTGVAAPFGTLQPLTEGGEGAAADPLITTVLTNSRIEAETPLGPITAQIEGEAWSEAPGSVAAVVSFDLAGEPGRLQGAFDVTRAPDGTTTGNLVVEDGTLALPGAGLGDLVGEAAFALAQDRPPAVDAKFSAGRITLPDAAFEEAHVSLRTEASRATLAGRMSGADGRWSLALAGTLDDYLAAPEARFDLTALAAAGAALWPLLALPDPAAGRAQARLNAGGHLPPLMELGKENSTPADWLERATLDGQLVAEAVGLAYPGRAEAVSADLRIDGAFEAGVLTFRLPRNARLDVTGLEPNWLRDIGLPDVVVPHLQDGATLAVRADGEAIETRLASTVGIQLSTRSGVELEAHTKARLDFDKEHGLTGLAFEDLRLSARAIALPGLRLREILAQGKLAGPPNAVAGELHMTAETEDVTFGALRAAKAAASLPVAIRAEPNSLSLQLREPGRVSLEGVGYGETIRFEAPLRLDLRQAIVEIARDRQDSPRVDHDLTLEVKPVPFVVARETGDMKAHLSPGSVQLEGTWSPDAPYRVTATIANAGLVLPEQKIAAEGIEATVTRGGTPDGLRADFHVGAIKHLAAVPLLAPLGLRGTLHGDDETLALSAQATATDHAAQLALTGTHRIGEQRGEARVELEPITFDPGGLQPVALAPPLASLRAVSGKLGARAMFAWAPGAMKGEANLSLDGLSFDSDEAKVEGLDLDLHLDRLFPPGSPAGQRLTVEHIDPGMPLDDVSVHFQVQPGEPVRLAVERGELSLIGGRVFLRDMLIDPAAARRDVPLEIEGLDLAELFRVLDIEGLSGSGRLSGQVPIAFEAETVTIDNARLEADGPGRLRFQSAQAAQLLAGAGESADLMLRALQDFHYDELSLTIGKPAAAEARLTLVLLGHNPDVLEGYPFRFNINLEGNTGQLVEALSQAYRLSNRMLRRVWR